MVFDVFENEMKRNVGRNLRESGGIEKLHDGTVEKYGDIFRMKPVGFALIQRWVLMNIR